MHFDEMIERLRCIHCKGSSLEPSAKGDLQEILCRTCQTRITVYAKEHRIDWIAEQVPDKLLSEIEKYDEWSELQQLTGWKGELLDLNGWLTSSPALKWARQKLEKAGGIWNGNVLDIGGSCKDSWRFLRAGAAKLLQLEPSAGSQRVGLSRLQRSMEDANLDWRSKIAFHTGFAECLPFKDETFDLVFSRATIHHTQRPMSYQEILRVLKPGGAMFIIEPVLPSTIRQLVLFLRRVRNVDRGTDDPLTFAELRQLKKEFSYFDFYIECLGLAGFEWILRKLLRQKVKSSDLLSKRLERIIGSVPFLGRISGGTGYIIGIK